MVHRYQNHPTLVGWERAAGSWTPMQVTERCFLLHILPTGTTRSRADRYRTCKLDPTLFFPPIYFNLSQAGNISEWFKVSRLVQKQQGVRSSSSAEDRGVACSPDRPEEEVTARGTARGMSASRMVAAGDLSDGSERDSGAQDSSNDADSEASESECGPRTSSLSHGHASTTSSTSTLTPSPTPASTSSPTSSSCIRRGGSVEQLVSAVSKVNLSFSTGDCSPHYSPEEQGEAQTRENLHQHHQGAFQALSHSYIPSSKECSIQSCLHQFTSVELLMGNNKLLCENCTERRQKHLRKSSSAGESIFLIILCTI